MTAVATLTGALSDRMTVRRLQTRMVKVVPRGTIAFRKERWQGLSGMQGNLHVPFLGGWAGAIPPGYPAHATPFGPTVPTLPFQWLIRQVGPPATNAGKFTVSARFDTL